VATGAKLGLAGPGGLRRRRQRPCPADRNVVDPGHLQ
jgi:hypothetical protein